MRTHKDTKAQGNVVSWFITVTIVIIIGLQVAWPVIDNAVSGGASATNNFTYSGNSTAGEYVNVTDDGGVVHCYIMNSTSGSGTQNGCIRVDISTGVTPTISAANLTISINSDPFMSGKITATTPVAGTTKITSVKKSAVYNSYKTTDTVANGAWLASTMTNGITDVSAMPASASVLISLIGLFLALTILMIFIRPLL